MVSPNVGGAIDEPGNIQCEHVTEDGGDEKSCFEWLSPKVPGNQCWHSKGECQNQRNVVPWTENETNYTITLHFFTGGVNSLSLENDDRVLQNIAHVDGFSAPFDFGMLLAQQPSDVGEKETAAGVVRISVRLAKFVVDAVISAPFVNVVLFVFGLGDGRNK